MAELLSAIQPDTHANRLPASLSTGPTSSSYWRRADSRLLALAWSLANDCSSIEPCPVDGFGSLFNQPPATNACADCPGDAHSLVRSIRITPMYARLEAEAGGDPMPDELRAAYRIL